MVLEGVVDEVLAALGEHHAVHLGRRVATRERDILGNLREPASERAKGPLEPAARVHNRLLAGEVPDARVPVLQVHHPQEGTLTDDDLGAPAMEAADGSGRTAAGGPAARNEVRDLIQRLEAIDVRLGGGGAINLPVAVREALGWKPQAS